MWDIRVPVLSAIFTHEMQRAHFESFTLKYKTRNSRRLWDKDRAALAPPGLADKPLLGRAECDLQENNTCSGLQDQPLETFYFLTWHFYFLTWHLSARLGIHWSSPACHTEMHSICGSHSCKGSIFSGHFLPMGFNTVLTYLHLKMQSWTNMDWIWKSLAYSRQVWQV